MKTILCALAAAAIASHGAAFAADFGATPVEEESVITPPVVELSPSEQAAVARSVAWRSKKAVLRTGPDGKVLFAFGYSQPTVVCAPLQVCDIEFEAGEIVKDVNLGDTVRWKIAPATSGPTGPGEIPHLIVKPNSVSLNTTLVVTTNRRTYSIRLKSVRGSYMDRVGLRVPGGQAGCGGSARGRACRPPSGAERPL